MQSRLSGLDTLRLLALGLVVLQHVATMMGGYADAQWRGISPGQTGVAIFCFISGFLSSLSVPSSRLNWVKRRLLVIFPAYWVVTAGAFALALITPYKHISIGLFLSQMMGTGYFTHGWELVNVVSWFVTLILTCYLLSLIGWSIPFRNTYWIIVAVLAIVLFASRVEVPFSRHILAYAGGVLFAANVKWRTVLAGLFGCAMIAGVSLDPQFFYAGASGILVAMALANYVPVLPWAEWVNKYSYEYFLVHGILLAVSFKFVSKPYWAASLGIVGAMMCAVIVNMMQRPVHGLLDRTFDRLTQSAPSRT